MSSLTPRRRRIVRATAPVVGLLAAGLLVWQGSNAAFTGSTTSGTNSWTAGQVTLTNNTGAAGAFVQNGLATFTVPNAKPGDSGLACITVRSNGNVPGTGKFYVSNVANTAAVPAVPGALNLSTGITLKVEEAPLASGTGGTALAANCSNAVVGTTITSAFTQVGTTQAIGSQPTTYAGGLGSWAVAGTANENRAYRITWAFPSTANDNLYQGAQVQAQFNWEVQ